MFSTLLAQTITSWQGLFDEGGPLAGTAYGKWVPSLLTVLSTVLWVVLALVGAAGGIYAIYVGIKMARADSAEQRDENKKRMINIIVAIVVTIVLIIFFNVFLPMIIGAFTSGTNWDDPNKKVEDEGVVRTILTAGKILLRFPL